MNKLWYYWVGWLSLLPVLLVAQSTPHDFYQLNKIQRIELTFDKDSWSYHLDSLRYNGDEMLLGNIRINGEALPEIGVRYQSGRGFAPGQQRNSLHIELDLIDPQQNYKGIYTLRLSNALRDPSMVREVLAYDIARQYMPAPQANYAKVYINNAYYGLFVNVEAIDEHFLNKHFGSSDGTFIHATPAIDGYASNDCKDDAYSTLQYDNAAKCYVKQYNLLSRRGWDDLIELTQILYEKPEVVNTILNVDRTLWMHAFNNVVGNLASYSGQYSQNYFLYQDEGGQFNPILSDMNFSFGSFKNTGIGSDLGVGDMIQLDPMLHANSASKPLISALLSQEKYRKMYTSHLRTLVKENFVDQNFTERVKDLQQMIRQDYIADINKFYAMEAFDRSSKEIIGKRSRIPGVADYMEKRTSWLKKQDLYTVLPPMVVEVEVEKRARFSPDKIDHFTITAKVDHFPKQVHVYYRLNGDPGFRQLEMLDDGQRADGEAGDQRYGVTIQPGLGQDSIEYFIVTENAQAISYSPEHYMYKRHTANLEELNQ